MNSFLETVLHDLKEKGIDLTTVTYVVPSRRVGIFLSRYLAKTIDQPVFLPEIYSVEEYIEQLAQVEILNDLDLLPLFYQAYKSIEPASTADSFDEFLGWATTILKDFNELDRYLVDPDAFFNYLSSIKEMDHWARNDNPTMMVSKYLEFWKKLHSYYDAFQKLCIENNVVYQGLAYRLAHARCKHLISSKEQVSNKTIFLGLNALNTAESQIIQSLLEEDLALIYWDVDRYLLDLPYHESGKFIRKFKKEWSYYKKQPLELLGNSYASQKSIGLHGAAGNLSMIQVAAQLMEQLAPEEIEDTAVILADERLLLPLLNAIPENIKNFNVTMGLSLDQLPIAAFIYDIIKIHTENSADGIYYKNVVQILESAFAYILIGKTARLLVKKIREENLIYISDNLSSSIAESSIFYKVLQPVKEVKDLMTLLREVVKELKNKFLEQDNRRIEIEQLLGITEVIHNLSTITENNKEIKDLKTISYLFKQLVPLKKMDFIGEPVRGLQIMGLLETRALDYKNIIMLSVNEGVLPAGKSTASYISNDMKYQFDLPTYSEKDSVYAYHFYRLLHRVENAEFIYNTEGDTLGGGEKSRFLTQLETDALHTHHITHQQYTFQNSRVADELMVIEKDFRYFDRLKQIASSGFSPSALTSYVRNPIEFYASKILRISELEDVEENIAANTMGSIIHEALDQLYQPHVGKVLIKEDFLNIKKQIKTTLEKAYRACYPSAGDPVGKNKIIYEVSHHYIKKMIQSDLDLVQKGNTLIIKSVERQLEGYIEVPNIGKVKIHGKVDRIDLLNEKLRIIDYKTGGTSKGNVGLAPDDFYVLKEDYKKSKAFQVLMYTYLYSLNETFTEVSSGIISFKDFNSGYISFSLKNGRNYIDQMIDIDILSQFETILVELIQELFDPEIPIEEKEV